MRKFTHCSRAAYHRTSNIETKVPNIESILASAVEISEFDQRQRFVDQSCGDDEALKERLQELIDNHFRAGSFLAGKDDEEEGCIFSGGTVRRDCILCARSRLCMMVAA